MMFRSCACKEQVATQKVADRNNAFLFVKILIM
jgi:hypothetical protein